MVFKLIYVNVFMGAFEEENLFENCETCFDNCSNCNDAVDC